MVVYLLERLVTSPLTIRIPGCYFLNKLALVSEVRDHQSMVGNGPLLHHAEDLRVIEHIDLHVGSILIHKFVGVGCHCVGVQVDNFNHSALRIEDDDLALVKHAEGIKSIFVVLLPKDLSAVVYVDEFLSGASVSSGDIDVSLHCCTELEYFGSLPCQSHSVCILDQ